MEDKSIENKVFVLRDSEGLPNKRVLEAVKNLHSSFSDSEGFVSLSLRGSVALGYWTPNSDIDLTVLYDSSGRSFLEIEKELENSLDRNGRSLFGEGIRYMDMKLPFYPIGLFSDLERMVAVFRLNTGSKIDRYRRQYVEELRNLPPDERRELISRAVSEAVEEEMANFFKIKKRLGVENAEDFKKRRVLLWHSRLERLLGARSDESKQAKELIGVH